MNQYVIYPTHAEIILVDKYSEECGRAIISLRVVNKCKSHHWCLHSKGYVVSDSVGLLHRYITAYQYQLVDHVDRNKLNNLDTNLRPLTNQLNLFNTKLFSTNTSGYNGVGRFRGGWRARIKVSGKDIHLGTFDTKEQAHIARIDYEIEVIERLIREANI